MNDMKGINERNNELINKLSGLRDDEEVVVIHPAPLTEELEKILNSPDEDFTDLIKNVITTNAEQIKEILK